MATERQIINTPIPSIGIVWDNGTEAYSGLQIEAFLKAQLQSKIGALYVDTHIASVLTVYLFRSVADKTTWLANQSNTGLIIDSQTFSISSDPGSSDILAAAKAYADSILKNYDDEIAAINLKINTANEVLESLL